MTRFDDDDLTELEAELRRQKPEPRPAFLAQMTARIDEVEPTRSRLPRFRIALAAAVLVAFLVPFTALGGIGFGYSALFGGAKGVGLSFTAKPKLSDSYVRSGGVLVLKKKLAVGNRAGATAKASAKAKAGSKAKASAKAKARAAKKTKRIGKRAGVGAGVVGGQADVVGGVAQAALLEYATYGFFCVEFPEGSGTYVNAFLPISAPYSVAFWLSDPYGIWGPVTFGPCGFPPPAV